MESIRFETELRENHVKEAPLCARALTSTLGNAHLGGPITKTCDCGIRVSALATTSCLPSTPDDQFRRQDAPFSMCMMYDVRSLCALRSSKFCLSSDKVEHDDTTKAAVQQRESGLVAGCCAIALPGR